MDKLDLDKLEMLNRQPNKSQIPLIREFERPSDYPIDKLPSEIRGVIKVVSDIVQVPIAIVGQSVMSVISFLSQGIANVKMDGRVIPVNSFFLSVALSGVRKTAVDNIVSKIVFEYEATELRKYRQAKREWDQEEQLRLKIEKAKQNQIIKDHSKETKEFHVEVRKLNFDEASVGHPPLFPQMVVQDATSEGLFKMLKNGRPSVIYSSDEGGQFVGGHAMSEDHELRILTLLSKLWDGKLISRIRAGEEPSYISKKRLSMHLMLQPGVAINLLSNKVAIEQGFLSRCLLSYPKPFFGERSYVSEDPAQRPEVVSFHEKCLRLLESPLNFEPGTVNDLELKMIEMDAGAKVVWLEFYKHVEAGLAENSEFSTITGFASKAPDMAIRLAGAIALFQNPKAQSINIDHMIAGISLMTYHLGEAKRLIGIATQNPDLVVAQKLYSWLKAKGVRKFETKRIYQFGPPELRDADSARKAIMCLDKFGWAKPDKDKKSWILVDSEDTDEP